jgi:hypothetical protein
VRTRGPAAALEALGHSCPAGACATARGARALLTSPRTPFCAFLSRGGVGRGAGGVGGAALSAAQPAGGAREAGAVQVGW